MDDIGECDLDSSMTFELVPYNGTISKVFLGMMGRKLILALFCEIILALRGEIMLGVSCFLGIARPKYSAN